MGPGDRRRPASSEESSARCPPAHVSQSLGFSSWLRLRSLELCEQGLIGGVESGQLDGFARRISSLTDAAPVAIGNGEVPIHERIVGAKSRRFDITVTSAGPILTLPRDDADFTLLHQL